MPTNATVTTTAAVGTAGSLALGPQAFKPVVGWFAELYGVTPLPSDDAQLGLATLAVMGGGGVVWLTVTIVNWALRKRGIINGDHNASV